MARFLKKERKRLGFNQDYIAEYTNVSMTSQSNYETGKRFPDSQYLLKLVELGFDINYVLTGKRDKNHFTNEEKFLLEKFRESDKTKKNMLLHLLMFNETADTIHQNIIGDVTGDGNKIKQKIKVERK